MEQLDADLVAASDNVNKNLLNVRFNGNSLTDVSDNTLGDDLLNDILEKHMLQGYQFAQKWDSLQLPITRLKDNLEKMDKMKNDLEQLQRDTQDVLSELERLVE